MDRGTAILIALVALLCVGLPHGCHYIDILTKRRVCADNPGWSVCDELRKQGEL